MNIKHLRFYRDNDKLLINEKILDDNKNYNIQVESIPNLENFYFGKKKFFIQGNKLKSEKGIIYIKKR